MASGPKRWEGQCSEGSRHKARRARQLTHPTQSTCGERNPAMGGSVLGGQSAQGTKSKTTDPPHPINLRGEEPSDGRVSARGAADDERTTDPLPPRDLVGAQCGRVRARGGDNRCLIRPRGPALLTRPRGPALLTRPRGSALLTRPRGPALLTRPRGPALLTRPRGRRHGLGYGGQAGLVQS